MFILCFDKNTFNENHLSYGQKRPKNHVGIPENYTWKKEACIKFVNHTTDFQTLIYSELARIYQLRNNKGNFFNVRVWFLLTNNARYSAFAVNSCSKLVIKVLVKKYNICSKSTLMTPKRYISCEENYLQCYFIVNYSYVVLTFLMVILVLWSFKWCKKLKGIAIDE